MEISFNTDIGGKTLTIKAGKVAKQASGSVGIVMMANPAGFIVYCIGCEAIEIHTGAYANAWLLHGSKGREEKVEATLDEICQGLDTGLEAGLVVHGGHGLTYDNVALVASLEGFVEFNIGHSIVSRALFTGLRDAVAEMKHLIA